MSLDATQVDSVRRSLSSGLRFRLLLLRKLPMGFFAGLRIVHLTDSSCAVSVPFKWMNRNPFGSTFWAVLGMAAETSTGALVLMYTYGQGPSVATIITGMTGRFLKKATGRTTFVCESGNEIAAAVQRAMTAPDPVEVVCPARGVDESGDVVAEFTFTWSMKRRAEIAD